VTLWTDAHCHLQDRFGSNGENAADVNATLVRAYEAGVDRVVVIGTDAASSGEALAITDLDGPVEIYATVGLHPHDATHEIGPVLEMARAGHPRLVGIGECGLDYFYEHSARSVQRGASSTWRWSSTPATRSTTCSTSSPARGYRRERSCTASPAPPATRRPASSWAATSRSRAW
jgi:hypothetical protein